MFQIAKVILQILNMDIVYLQVFFAFLAVIAVKTFLQWTFIVQGYNFQFLKEAGFRMGWVYGTGCVS